MAITRDFANAMQDLRRAISAVEAASPFPGVYTMTAPNGETVHGELAIQPFGTTRRVWSICGTRFWDEQITGWKIGPRVSGPGLRGNPVVAKPAAVIAYMAALVRVFPAGLVSLSHSCSTPPVDDTVTDVVTYRLAQPVASAEAAVEDQDRVHAEVERVAPHLVGHVALRLGAEAENPPSGPHHGPPRAPSVVQPPAPRTVRVEVVPLSEGSADATRVVMPGDMP